MVEAKDINDSLDFLRYFEKYTENPDLGTLIKEKISADKKRLELNGCQLKEEDFKTPPPIPRIRSRAKLPKIH